MKHYPFAAFFFLVIGGLFAQSPAKNNNPELLSWNALWSGSWEDSKTLHNRMDLRLGLPETGLFLRGQALDKHTMNFELDPPWGDSPEGSPKGASKAGAGLYHKPTGSRLLFGVLDEWGLPARIRNPWTRSAPFVENHKPLMADLKTVSSASKEPEMHLYLSTPFVAPLSALFPNTLLRAFTSTQTQTEGVLNPDFSGGVEARFGRKINLLVEGFCTGGELPARNSKSWFANPPPLPEREYKLYAAGMLFTAPKIAVSSDWAYSETFVLGKDVYGNLGIRVTPFPAWSVSLAADGGGKRFTGRNGSSPGAGFRTAAKFELKGKRNSLLRFGTSLRGPGMGEDFNRSEISAYYRFPAPDKKIAHNGIVFPLRVTRLSLSLDRNAANIKKPIDGINCGLGLTLNLPHIAVFAGNKGGAQKKAAGSPLGINLSTGIKTYFDPADETPGPYPFPEKSWRFESAKAGCELSWTQGPLQLKTKAGYSISEKKEGKWDTSIGASFRFKQGRLGVKAAAPELPGKWDWTISWRLEKK